MGQKIQYSVESIQFETKSKVGINEIYSTAKTAIDQ